jgi:DNA-directed RNA polymerase subunit RPC12/RpoP
MGNLITLSCPSCGGVLEVTQNTEQLVCSYCGQRHVVKHEGTTLSLSPVLDALNQVKAGVDRTAAELAIVRLQKEIAELNTNRTAFLGANPKPVSKASNLVFAILAVVIGSLIALTGLCALMGNSLKSSLPILLVGIIILGAGVLGLVLRNRPAKSWEKNIEPRIKAQDALIAKSDQELQQFRKMVSL